MIAPRKPPYPAKDAFVKVEILQGMAEERLPRIALRWIPKQKRARRKTGWKE
jgi:hypothetical protein